MGLCKNRVGVGLVELLMAVLVGSVVIAGAVLLVTQNKKNSVQSEGKLDQKSDAYLAMHSLKRDLEYSTVVTRDPVTKNLKLKIDILEAGVLTPTDIEYKQDDCIKGTKSTPCLKRLNSTKSTESVFYNIKNFNWCFGDDVILCNFFTLGKPIGLSKKVCLMSFEVVSSDSLTPKLHQFALKRDLYDIKLDKSKDQIYVQ